MVNGKREKNLPWLAERLKTARIMAGLSLGELSDKMGGTVTRQALSKYELGRMRPAPDVLARLQETLRLKSNFIHDPGPLALNQVHFRKHSPLPRKEEAAIKVRAADFLSRYRELEEILGRAEPFRNPLTGRVVKNVDDAETAAETLRRAWNLGTSPIMNLLNLLEKKGIKIFFIPKNNTLDGLASATNSAPLIVLSKGKPTDRLRFTAAHELAHLLCSFEKSPENEHLCHRFASAFLLPAEVLIEELQHKRNQVTFWELGIIKENFGISMQAVLHRARALNIISEHHFKRQFATMKTRGWDRAEPIRFSGREEPLHFRQLLNYAANERIIGFDRAAELAAESADRFRQQIEIE